mmetsp:Transcript_5236/g.6432  ORF Transcript_5236/g.6432 Transcript_5236/m.6432 type:complete len:110 (-) Transcript_5236:311-640(-)|eukprot:CAMPEP_0185756006 /NCGR_PEP_ID=MMETSP1174-20130828/14465_1 /TAXON_ID=35687 /ORGANISM="Dictyocha speculum, Strain CCMP1381" /LENGTH=109 /DNA_ID=CAMNT_0028434791 /DNA_START=44 /DNA_END=373 /DNA_ORIENTATION=+
MSDLGALSHKAYDGALTKVGFSLDAANILQCQISSQVRPEAKEVSFSSATSAEQAFKLLDAYAAQNPKYMSGDAPSALKGKITAANPAAPVDETAAAGSSTGWTPADDY